MLGTNLTQIDLTAVLATKQTPEIFVNPTAVDFDVLWQQGNLKDLLTY